MNILPKNECFSCKDKENCIHKQKKEVRKPFSDWIFPSMTLIFTDTDFLTGNTEKHKKALPNGRALFA